MRIILIISITLSSIGMAKQPTELMLMGTFHFANPGLDTVKSKTINVMTQPSQDYLKKLSKRISEFKPTMVLLEFNPKNTDKINQEYQKYLKGEFQLPSNEIYQVGFRVAKHSGIKQLGSLDERSVGWKAEALFEYMKNKDSVAQAEFDQIIKEVTEQTNKNHSQLALKHLLEIANDETYDRINKNIYLATNAVAVADGEFYGADASASWWHRNFRIYAKIQYQAQKHQRIFALAGQGHTAILKDFIEIDEKIKAIDIPF